MRTSVCILLGHRYVINIKLMSISMTDIMTRVLGRYKVYTVLTKNEGTYNWLNFATFIEVPVPEKDSRRPSLCVDFDSASTFYLLECGGVPTGFYFCTVSVWFGYVLFLFVFVFIISKYSVLTITILILIK